MNQNTSGAVLLLIMAAAGLATDNAAAWQLAALTAGLAFLANEMRAADEFLHSRRLRIMTRLTAIASWATTIAAALLLWRA